MDTGARIPIESDEEFDRWFWGDRSMERPGDGQSQRPSALQAEAPADLSPGHSIDSAPARGVQCSDGNFPGAGSIDFDRPPALTPWNAGWYRRRAEDLGDLAAELIYEGLDGTAYGQAMRAAHYGRIALDLYSQRKDEWLVTHHPSNFL